MGGCWVPSAAQLGGEITDQTIAVLPLGATEQHGPHLPFETDTIIAQGVCDRLIAAIPQEMDIRFLPVEPVGYSPEHMDFEGSKTLAFDEAVERWIGIGETAARAGVKRFMLLNAHGGNSPLAAIVIQELRVRCGMLAVATKWDRFIKGSGIVSADEEAFGIHGGDIETSVMLALRPELVRMEKAEQFSNLQQTMTIDCEHLRAYGPHSFGWMMRDLNPQGVAGAATAATIEKGNALLAGSAAGMVALLQEVKDFDLKRLT